MSKRSDKLLLEDMVEAIAKIDRYTAELTYDQFIEEEMVIDAVARNLEIIGEAANRLSSELHENAPAIPWRQIVGFRNRVVHEYFGLDLAIVWTISRQNLPVLQRQLQELLARQ